MSSAAVVTGALRVNPIALRMAKTLWSFGHSECNRVKVKKVMVSISRGSGVRVSLCLVLSI